MNPLGGVDGLFGIALEAVKRVRTYQSFSFDSQALQVQFDADRIKLERWGREVGLHDARPGSHVIFDDKTLTTVKDVLEVVYQVMASDDALVGDGSAMGGGHGDNDGSLHGITFDKAFEKMPNSRRFKMGWAMGGKGKRKEQVELFARLVKLLQELVPLEHQQRAVNIQDESSGKATSQSEERPELDGLANIRAIVDQIITDRKGSLSHHGISFIR